MISTHRIVKYFAYALAAGIIISIITLSSIVFEGVTSFFVYDKNTKITDKYEVTDNSNIKKLIVKLSNSSLIIKEGVSLKVETNSKDITVNEKNNILEVKENNRNLFNSFNKEKVYLYIPKNNNFDLIDISSGVGETNIISLYTNQLTYEIGAGKANIDYLYVLKKATISCGAGQLNINNSEINNLNLDLGVGETNLTGSITGESNITSGIGSLNININGLKEDYRFKVDKGIGTIKIDNEEVVDEKTYGSGSNYIDLEGGIGSIKVNFND